MEEVTVYSTASQAVRSTADNCRRLLALLDAFGVAVTILLVDSPEMRAFVQELLEKQKHIGRENQGIRSGSIPAFQLPLCFIGPLLVGTYDEIAELNEAGELPGTLRAAGYGGVFRAPIHNDIPVGNVAALAAAVTAISLVNGEDVNEGDMHVNRKEVKNDIDDDDDVFLVDSDVEDYDYEDDDELPPPPPPPDDDDDDDDVFLVDSDVEDYDYEDDDDELPPPPPPDDEEDEEEDEFAPPPPPPPPLED